ncbi:hypothetical protein SCG7086_AL_00180 [Chlamydiales bacterium SCGC AG-110-P3]|nr:hypothetical protein SCG7086_AL_00180 [Chlamydiales bacterium SCGC AG-110-P3]
MGSVVGGDSFNSTFTASTLSAATPSVNDLSAGESSTSTSPAKTPSTEIEVKQASNDYRYHWCTCMTGTSDVIWTAASAALCLVGCCAGPGCVLPPWAFYTAGGVLEAGYLSGRCVTACDGRRQFGHQLDALAGQIHQLTKGEIRLEKNLKTSQGLAQDFEIVLGNNWTTWMTMLDRLDGANGQLADEMTPLVSAVENFETIARDLKNGLSAAARIGDEVLQVAETTDTLGEQIDRVDSAAGTVMEEIDAQTNLVERMEQLTIDYKDSKEICAAVTDRLNALVSKIMSLNSDLEETTTRLEERIQILATLQDDGESVELEAVRRELTEFRNDLQQYQKEAEDATRLSSELQATLRVIVKMTTVETIQNYDNGEEILVLLRQLEVLSDD